MGGRTHECAQLWEGHDFIEKGPLTGPFEPSTSRVSQKEENTTIRNRKSRRGIGPIRKASDQSRTKNIFFSDQTPQRRKLGKEGGSGEVLKVGRKSHRDFSHGDVPPQKRASVRQKKGMQLTWTLMETPGNNLDTHFRPEEHVGALQKEQESWCFVERGGTTDWSRRKENKDKRRMTGATRSIVEGVKGGIMLSPATAAKAQQKVTGKISASWKWSIKKNQGPVNYKIADGEWP